MITITIHKIGDETLGTNQIMGILSEDIAILESSDNTTGGYAIVTLQGNHGINTGKKLTLTDTYATTLEAVTSDRVLSGAESTANKNASGGYAGLSLYKLQLKNNAGSKTSTIENTNSNSRAYTLPDVAGGILVGAKISAGALVAGVRAVTVTGVSSSSTAVVQKVSLGGTVAAGGYKVVCTTDTVTITALKVDGTTTESGCTDSVMGIVVLL